MKFSKPWYVISGTYSASNPIAAPPITGSPARTPPMCVVQRRSANFNVHKKQRDTPPLSRPSRRKSGHCKENKGQVTTHANAGLEQSTPGLTSTYDPSWYCGILNAGSDPNPSCDTIAAITAARVTVARSRASTPAPIPLVGAFASSSKASRSFDLPRFPAFSNTVSNAKNTPEMGALNPALMPAADPAARSAVA